MNYGGWEVTAVAQEGKIFEKWQRMATEWDVTTNGENEWPTVAIGDGNNIMEMINQCRQTPEWVIVDGGALHGNTTKQMAMRRLQLWGVHGAVSVWTVKTARDYQPRKHGSVRDLASRMATEVQRRAVSAYYALDEKRFKAGVTEEDFNLENIREAMATNPREVWGDECQRKDFRLQPMWDWPEEPTTTKMTIQNADVNGREVEEKETEAERATRIDDLQHWIAGGQRWIDAFTPEATLRVKRFLNDNARAVDAVMGANEVMGKKKFGKVQDLYLQECDYRPGARRKLWHWTNGNCEETVPRNVTLEASYNREHIKTAAQVVGFKDEHALQMLVEWGATMGTKLFPWCSYASRNHQGASEQPQAITDMFKEKVEMGHFLQWTEDIWATTPQCLPFGVVPVNGTVQRPKEPEMWKKLKGQPYEENIRGTWDGSSPHDGNSPNEFCDLLPDLNPKWVTATDIVQSLCVLLSIGVEVEMFKIDLKRAYTQLIMSATQRWRQVVYWRWRGEDKQMKGGYMMDGRAMWGVKHIGSAFFRTITTITVKWVTYELLTKWAPNVRCPKAKAWSTERSRAGYNATQCMPATIQAFLDDFWIPIASSIKQERDDARQIVLKAFEYLHWTLSMSKFEEEGTLATNAVLIGHHICTKTATRGVMPIKQERLRTSITRMLKETRWNKKELSQVLGLAESVRGDVKRRWRLGPLYRVLHAGSDEHWTRPSERSKSCLRKVMGTLHERRSLLWRPTAWTIPRNPTQQMIPNTDAAGQGGFGGCLLMGKILLYFTGEWTKELREARVNIAVLEAWAVVMAATTWGPYLQGKKVIFRSDSSPACFCMNKLSSDIDEMTMVVNAWEDLQFEFAFEGLLVHCAGKLNTLADIASRADQNNMQKELRHEMQKQELGEIELKQCEVVWNVNDIDINYEEQLLYNRKQQDLN